jgi:hypothetical protein
LIFAVTTHNSASDGTDIKLSEMALAITTMAQQQLTILAAVNSIAATGTDSTNTTTKPSIGSNMTVAPLAKKISTKQIINTMMTPQDRVVAATLHDTHFASSSDNNSISDSGATSTNTGTSNDDSNDANSTDNNAGIGPMLDMTAYSRFESTLAKLQVHASDIVRVDNQAIGTGGFAKVYKVLLKGNQLCAAKVSVTIDTCHALLLSYTLHSTARYIALCSKHDSNNTCVHVMTLSLFAAMILQVVKLQDLSVKQKQRMYLRFTKELFILHQLQHESFVPVYACASTLDEVTLVMKVILAFYTANDHVIVLLY